MSISDAKEILTGGDDAATQYFKRATYAPLTTDGLSPSRPARKSTAQGREPGRAGERQRGRSADQLN